MASNANSRIDYQTGEVPFPMGEITSSDDKKFDTLTPILTDSYDIRPNGVLTGGLMTGTTTDNQINIGTLELNLNGVIATIAAGNKTIVRAGTDVASISSITITSAGAVAVIKGTDSASTAFSEVRGDAGAPPFIPVDSVEIGQVRTTTNAASVFNAGDVFQIEGAHMETAGFPVYEADVFTGKIVFDLTLPLTHTGGVAKKVFASYSKPVFTEQKFSNDFVPAETSYSTSSEQVYSATIGSSSSTLGQGSFTAILKDGITDPILASVGKNLMFRYFQDRNKPAHILTQGVLGTVRSFAASDNPKVALSISPNVASVNRAA